MTGEHVSNRTAAEWIARLNADSRTSEDDQAFRAWLAQSPDNEAAFERATDLWAIVPGASVAPAVPRTPILSRRRVLAAGIATVTGGGALVAVQSAYAGTRYETGIGEQRHVTLAEGSALFLDADTRVRVIASPQRRQLWLQRGRIALSVRPAPVPFTVEAGKGSLIAGPGRFDLRRDDADRLALTALSGKADVAIAGARRSLETGERVRADAAAALQVDRPDPEATLAWQSGRAAFHEDRLEAVAAEANRYSTTRLVIADPRTAGLRVSGMYRMGDNVALAQALSQLLSIRAREVEGAVLLGG